jgi:hypothetical protein
LFNENLMLAFPDKILDVLRPSAPVFSERIWDWVQGLVVAHVWGLPFLTVLADNRASNQTRGQRHKNRIDLYERCSYFRIFTSEVRILKRLPLAL